MEEFLAFISLLDASEPNNSVWRDCWVSPTLHCPQFPLFICDSAGYSLHCDVKAGPWIYENIFSC